MSRHTALLALAAASLGCAGISSGSSAPGSPAADGGTHISTGTGATSGGCLTDMCVPQLATPDVLAVEIDPPSSSPSGVTQILGRDVSTADLYQAEPAATVTAGFAVPTGGTVPSSADVVLMVPPTIPGRPDLSFQSVGASPDSKSVTATLTVPQDAIGAAATLSLVPLPPADQTLPIYNFAMPVSTMMMASLPSDDVVISGQIQLASQMPPQSTFVARAFAVQGGAQVSDAELTRADGTFQMRIPAAAAAANQVTIQLSPSAPSTSAPKDAWFVSDPLFATPGKDLGVITLPPYNAPVVYDIVVAQGQQGISGVNVRVQAKVGSTTGTTTGTATYINSAGTDMTGVAALSFLPASTNASANTAIAYTITATPPIGSAYTISCKPNVIPLAAGGTGSGGTPLTLATLTLMARPVVSGTVVNAAGVPLSGVTVTASGTPDALMGCPAPAAVTASTTTSTSGVFSLPLDPGTYQLDYDPPSGSPAPRMTELGVPVGQTSVEHDVTLPNGARVTGKVVGGTGSTPVGSATVRFFKPQCTGQDDCFGSTRTAPLLVGKALTDSSGNFRMIIPLPSSPQ